MRNAATYLADRKGWAELEEEFGSLTPIQQSLVSIQLYQMFLSRCRGARQVAGTEPSLSAVRVHLRGKWVCPTSSSHSITTSPGEGNC